MFSCPLTFVWTLQTLPLKFFFVFPFKIFDASTNKWKLVDEKQHTDVYEKIIERPTEEDLLYRRNITDETNIINNLERNLLQEKLDEKHTRTTDSVDYLRSDHLIDESIATSDLVNQVVIKEDVKTRSDIKVSCRSDLELFKLNIFLKILFSWQKKIDKSYLKETTHKEQCICEMCTCG